MLRVLINLRLHWNHSNPDLAEAPNYMGMFPLSASFSPAPEPISRRAAIFIGVVAFHICIIALLVFSRHADQQKQKQGTLSVFAVVASPGPPAVIIPEPVMPAAELAVIASPAEAFAEQEQAVEGDPDGEVCSPLNIVTVQLASDPLVPLAISRVPQADRSISEAIVMWNVEWSTTAAKEAPLADIRNRVVAILKALPPDCLAMPVIGPRLIAIPEQGNTTFLAFGSGEWSWQQLIETNEVSTSKESEWTWGQLIEGELPSIF